MSSRTTQPTATVAAFLCLFTACGKVEGPAPSKPTVNVDVHARRPPKQISAYNLFADPAKGVFVEGIVPYEVNTPGFHDYANMSRHLWLPPGSRATYNATGVFEFPVGSILIQTLGFLNDLRDPAKGERIVETRLMIHKADGWVGVPYLWDATRTDARRAVVGGQTGVEWTHTNGEVRSATFFTPDMNQCKQCHKDEEGVRPIGMTAANLNRVVEYPDGAMNQIAYWMENGLLEGAPEEPAEIPSLPVWNDPETGSLDARARAWLDVNCAHCHNPIGGANVTGLDLSRSQTSPVRFGVYKPPVAAGRGSAGRRFSVEPGKPDKSFLAHRIESTELGIMMPPIGRSLFDEEGLALVNEWIASIPVDESLQEAALNPMIAYKEAVSGGDADRGRALFYDELKCVLCHTAEKEGEGDVGPDLRKVDDRATREYLVESMVDPSKHIVEGYETVVLFLIDGEILTGAFVSEDTSEVVISTMEGERIGIAKEDIDERRDSELSVMPSITNLVDVQGVSDLVEYLMGIQGRE